MSVQPFDIIDRIDLPSASIQIRQQNIAPTLIHSAIWKYINVNHGAIRYRVLRMTIEISSPANTTYVMSLLHIL